MKEATKEIATEDIVNELYTGNHGGFAAKLADAWFVADSLNRARIESTWAHLFTKVRSLLETKR